MVIAVEKDALALQSWHNDTINCTTSFISYGYNVAQAQAIKVEREKVYRRLATLYGIEAFPSDANFISH